MNIITDREIIYSNGDGMSDDTKKALIGAGVAGATAIVGGIAANRAKKKEAQSPSSQPAPKEPQQNGMSKGLKTGLIVGGSVLVVSTLIFLIVKASKK